MGRQAMRERLKDDKDYAGRPQRRFLGPFSLGRDQKPEKLRFFFTNKASGLVQGFSSCFFRWCRRLCFNQSSRMQNFTDQELAVQE